jgi:hypothetical protein
MNAKIGNEAGSFISGNICFKFSVRCGYMYIIRAIKNNFFYEPMIYTVPCIMIWMRAYPLRGEVGGGWALEFESFLGPVKWHRADMQVPFGDPKT